MDNKDEALWNRMNILPYNSEYIVSNKIQIPLNSTAVTSDKDTKLLFNNINKRLDKIGKASLDIFMGNSFCWRYKFSNDRLICSDPGCDCRVLYNINGIDEEVDFAGVSEDDYSYIKHKLEFIGIGKLNGKKLCSFHKNNKYFYNQ